MSFRYCLLYIFFGITITGFGQVAMYEKDQVTAKEGVIKVAKPRDMSFGKRQIIRRCSRTISWDQNILLKRFIKYPDMARINSIEGTVAISLRTHWDGEHISLNDIKIRKSLGYGCDEEALRLVKQYGKNFMGARTDEDCLIIVEVRFKDE